jgi:predicted dienelactone hydrolase
MVTPSFATRFPACTKRIVFAVSSMLDDRRSQNYVDTKRMGLIGHSLGGYTALGVAGAWPSWRDRRFKAVLAFSPYLAPYLKNGGLKRLAVPVMYQGGTAYDLTPDLRRNCGAYAHTPAPKYFIELDGAGHQSWTEVKGRHHSIIRKTALQFLNKYVKGDDGIEILLEGQDKPGRPVNKVKTFWMDEGDESLKN